MNQSVALARPYARRDLHPLDARRNNLVAELAVQRRALAEYDAALDELAPSMDREDADTRAVTRHLRTRALETIDDIERTLARMDEGSYDSCAQCAGPIGDTRLEALPLTQWCVRCASTAVSRA